MVSNEANFGKKNLNVDKNDQNHQIHLIQNNNEKSLDNNKITLNNN